MVLWWPQSELTAWRIDQARKLYDQALYEQVIKKSAGKKPTTEKKVSK